MLMVDHLKLYKDLLPPVTAPVPVLVLYQYCILHIDEWLSH